MKKSQNIQSDFNVFQKFVNFYSRLGNIELYVCEFASITFRCSTIKKEKDKTE